jgi:hypothetical protein
LSGSEINVDVRLVNQSGKTALTDVVLTIADVTDWESFETEFGALYHETLGRPGKPTRLMVGLSYLKHSYSLSDVTVASVTRCDEGRGQTKSLRGVSQRGGAANVGSEA